MLNNSKQYVSFLILKEMRYFLPFWAFWLYLEQVPQQKKKTLNFFFEINPLRPVPRNPKKELLGCEELPSERECTRWRLPLFLWDRLWLFRGLQLGSPRIQEGRGFCLSCRLSPGASPWAATPAWVSQEKASTRQVRGMFPGRKVESWAGKAEDGTQSQTGIVSGKGSLLIPHAFA